jgi:leader peptidase (prepilin peptidase) / N-methyltransferase
MTLAPPFIAVAFASLMAAIAISDWRRYRVPDPLTAAALALRGLAVLLPPSSLNQDDLLAAAIRAAAMAALFYGFRVAYRRLRGRDGLGLGDVKLAAVAGAWVDWRLLPFVIEFAALSVFALALIRAARSGAGLGAATKLPFAVGLAPGIFLGWQLQRLGF